MTTRDSDARVDIEEGVGSPTPRIIGFRNPLTGQEVSLDSNLGQTIYRYQSERKAVELTPQEQDTAAKSLREMLTNAENNYPDLTRSMLARPSTMFLYDEVGFALSDGAAVSQTVQDAAAETVSTIINDPQEPWAVRDYNTFKATDTLQQIFWEDVASKLPPQSRDYFLQLFAGQSKRGAARLASRGLVWVEEKDLSDPDTQAEFMLFMHAESRGEQQFDLMDTGVGGFFDAPENFKDRIFEKIANWGLGIVRGPEDAVRASGLSVGEQAVYAAGFNVADNEPLLDWTTPDLPFVGEVNFQMNAWQLGSGILDGYSEFAHDPLNLLAQAGIASKAVKVAPLGAKVTKAGRLAAASRAFFAPIRRTAGTTSHVRGGRVARTLYMMRAKTIDNLIDSPSSRKVLEDFAGLVRAGNMAEATLRHPKLAAMPDHAIDVIQNLSPTTDDVAEVVRHVMMNDVDNLAGEVIESARIAKHEALADLQSSLPEGIPRHLPLEDIIPLVDEGVDAQKLSRAMLSSVRYDQVANKKNVFYLVGDEFQARKFFTRAKFYERAGKVGGTKGASAAARITPGAPRGAIALADDTKAVRDLNELFMHYGIRKEKYMPVINEFLAKDLGARQDFIFENVLPLIGEERGIGVLKYNLIQLYSSGKLRQFSSLHNDIWSDLLGKVHRGPVYASQFTGEVPIPVHNIDNILNRVKVAGNKGVRLRTKSWADTTTTKRSQLANRFKKALGKEGVDLTDEEAYTMAYSILTNGADGRGWVASTLLPKAGSVWDAQHNFFKFSMLLNRAVPWAGRVNMEEALRGFINNMTSLARNPFEALWTMYNSGVVNKAIRSQKLLSDVADAAVRRATQGIDNVDDLLKNLGPLANDIFPDGAPASLSAARRQTEKFIDHAVATSAGLHKLDPLTRVRRSARTAARRTDRARQYLEDTGLSLKQADAAFEAIQMQQVSRGFVGDAAGIFSPQPSFYIAGGAAEDLTTHGQKLGFHILRSAEDTFGKMAYMRWVDELRGVPYGADRTARALTENSKWPWLKHDLMRRFDGVTDDVQLAQRYFDEIVGPENKYYLEPLLEGQDDLIKADLIEGLVTDKRLNTTVAGHDLNLNFEHPKTAADNLGELVVTAGDDITWPKELAALPFDPRIIAKDPKLSRKMLQFFGDELSQKINRRPAFMGAQRRWKKQFEAVGIPEELATKMAAQKAATEVNSVFFDPELAPHLVKKLERYIPFFKATYEVASQWLYKMPVAAGGYYPMGVGEFARKIDRTMQALVETGFVVVEEQGGKRNFVLELGDAAVNLGDPLNPTSFGMLSFFQFTVGANPLMTWGLSEVKGKLPWATDDRRDAALEGESWAEMSQRLGVDPAELARLNRGLFYDGDLGELNYLRILSGVTDISDIPVPFGTVVRIPQSGVGAALEELLLPMGETTFTDLPLAYLPQTVRNLFMGWGLNFVPTDEFWEEGDFGGMEAFIPKQMEASVLSQASEQMMYLEAHELVDGKGPLRRIMDMEIELANLPEGSDLTEAKMHEIEEATNLYLKLVKEGTAGALVTKGLMGQILPTTPRKLRENAVEINSYWASREYADSLRAGDGKLTVQPFETIEQIDEFYAMVGEWLKDPKGDGAKARFARQNPNLLAYLTPKTFYDEIPPEINAFDDWVDQIRSGERETASPHVTAMRYYQAVAGTDFFNAYAARYGSDPLQAAANAVEDRLGYRELQEARADAYTAIDMFDDMRSNEYENWRKDRGDKEDWQLDAMIDRRRDIQSSLAILLEMAEDDESTIDAAELREDADTFRKAIALLSESIRGLQDDEELAEFRNPYEEAYNRYFQEIYIPYQQGLSALYDQVDEQGDSERAQLLYEEIRNYRNENNLTPPVIDGVTFSSPADYQWAGKQPEEQGYKMQQWLTRPLEWMDLTQVRHVIEHAPALEPFLPTSLGQFDVYRQATFGKIAVQEMYEANEIGSGERSKMNKAIDEDLRRQLILQGRGAEAQFMDMLPWEKLRLAGLLPHELDNEHYAERLGFLKEELARAGKSADSNDGRIIVNPFMVELTNRANSDPHFMSVVRELGENIFKKGRIDAIFPALFFDARER